MTTPIVPQRTCKTCNQTFPLTDEYWHRESNRNRTFRHRCKECARAKMRANYLDARNRRLEYHRQYYNAHKPERHEYIHANAGRIAEQKRNWRKANPDKVKKHKAESQRRNRTSANKRTQKWAKRHPEKIRELCLNQHARRKNAPGAFAKEDIALQLRSQKHKCWWCGKRLKGREYHIDHRIPLSRGGSNNPDNLVIACPSCNMSKSDKLPSEWNGRLL